MNEKEPSPGNYVDVTCGVIRNSEGKILIARRGPHKAFPGKWEFPGGRVEPGETPEVCLTREILEELGMFIKVEKLVLNWEHDYGGPNRKFRFFAFHCQLLGGKYKLEDHDLLAWVKIEELANFDLLEADKKLAEALHNAVA